MTWTVDPGHFRRVYQQSVTDVMRFITPDRQALFARHDLSLHPDKHDLRVYLMASERRYMELLALVNSCSTQQVPNAVGALEVGGFLGAYPLTLARLGVPVTLAEKYGYYYGTLDDLAEFLTNQGVNIWDVDFTEPLPEAPPTFSLVTNMAMIEHLPSSPKKLMDNLRSCLDENGLLILEVPNVAYWPNRLEALRGLSIHQPLELVYESEPPYLGHHREYTVDELCNLLAWSGFRVCDVRLFNYSLSLGSGSWKLDLYTLLVYLWPTIVFPKCREVIMAAAAPAPA
jgi:SAM-dependent methyltransferase